MKTPHGTEVDLGPGHIVLDGVPALRERGTAAPLFRPMSIVAIRSPISATAELLYCLLHDCWHRLIDLHTGSWCDIYCSSSSRHLHWKRKKSNERLVFFGGGA